MWDLQDDIAIGYLDEAKAANVHADIQYILNIISKARPFIYLDLNAEKGRYDLLFGEESVKRINAFLKHTRYKATNIGSRINARIQMKSSAFPMSKRTLTITFPR